MTFFAVAQHAKPVQTFRLPLTPPEVVKKLDQHRGRVRHLRRPDQAQAPGTRQRVAEAPAVGCAGKTPARRQ